MYMKTSKRQLEDSQLLMEDDVLHSLGIIKSFAVFKCLRLSLNPNLAAGFDSSLLINHACRVALC